MSAVIGDVLSFKLFEGIEEKELQDLFVAQGARFTSYEKNEVLITAGEKVESIGVVVKGSISVESYDYAGHRNIVNSSVSGYVFAEAVAFSSGGSPVTVSALEKTSVLFIPVTVISGCSLAARKLTYNLIRGLAAKTLALNRKINILLNRTIREKLTAYLIHESAGRSGFTLPLSREGMADYLGVNRSALSRELSCMKSEGLIDYHKNAFRLLKGTWKS